MRYATSKKKTNFKRSFLFSNVPSKLQKENNQCYLWQKSKQNSPKSFDLLCNLTFYEKVTLYFGTDIDPGRTESCLKWARILF